MIHLRIVAPADRAERTLELLTTSNCVSNVVHLPKAAQKPEGDLILCDVAREEASVILSDLRELNLHTDGSIAMEMIDTEISKDADRAEEAAAGLPSDAVVWEEVESRTSESTELSFTFLAFMVLAMLIAAVGVLIDSPILIVGAMVVGPEFGPIAGFCVAVVELRGDLARRSIAALAIGFPLGIAATLLLTLVLKWTGLAPDDFGTKARPLTNFISDPDFLSFLVAYLAGTAGVLSLTSAKSGALIGVLISVTTIPAAANTGVAAAYADWAEFRGALSQLSLNLAAIMLAGVVTLFVQRRLYLVRRERHLHDRSRRAAGLSGDGERPGLARPPAEGAPSAAPESGAAP